MRDSFRLTTVIHAKRERVYDAWLNSKEHGAFTEDEMAKIVAALP
jgi:hypothetical protein